MHLSLLVYIQQLQKNWIGKSIGAEITFDIKNSDQKITAFTTRIDTVYGVSYLVLASNHPLIDQLINDKDMNRFCLTLVSHAKREFGYLL